jgi:hypothetical protein
VKFERMEAGRDAQGANVEKKERKHYGIRGRESAKRREGTPKWIFFLSCCCVYAYASFKHPNEICAVRQKMNLNKKL